MEDLNKRYEEARKAMDLSKDDSDYSKATEEDIKRAILLETIKKPRHSHNQVKPASSTNFVNKVDSVNFGTRLVMLLSVLGGGFGTGSYVADIYFETPDEVGTSMEESIMAGHAEAFNQLKLTKLELDQATAEYNLKSELNEDTSNEQASIDDLTTKFRTMANDVATGLYLDGITESEAAISEVNFEAQRSKLITLFNETETVSGLPNSEASIEAGALDECIAETNLHGSDNDMLRSADRKDLNQCMVNYYESGKDALPVAILFGLALGAIGGTGIVAAGRKVSGALNRKRLPTNY